jgi:plasmid stabilization system protein ParE
MKKRYVIWSPRATSELNHITHYYKTRNGNAIYIRSIQRKIKENLRLAVRYPHLFQATSNPDVRSFPCEYFRVFYRIYDTYVLVEAVFDMRQDPNKMPFEMS